MVTYTPRNRNERTQEAPSLGDVAIDLANAGWLIEWRDGEFIYTPITAAEFYHEIPDDAKPCGFEPQRWGK